MMHVMSTSKLSVVGSILPSGTSRASRRHVIVRAEDDQPKLDFSANKRSALGFTESDSAGQTNIFAVEPKSYVKGSTSDATADAGNSTVGGASVAGTVAVGIVVAALLLLNKNTVTSEGPEEGLLSLSAYKDTFASEIAARAPAPAPEAAPEVTEMQ